MPTLSSGFRQEARSVPGADARERSWHGACLCAVAISQQRKGAQMGDVAAVLLEWLLLAVAFAVAFGMTVRQMEREEREHEEDSEL
jgi:hypothetical protein